MPSASLDVTPSPRAPGGEVATIPFFADLPEEDLNGVLQVGRPVSFDTGGAIVREGEPGDAEMGPGVVRVALQHRSEVPLAIFVSPCVIRQR